MNQVQRSCRIKPTSRGEDWDCPFEHDDPDVGYGLCSWKRADSSVVQATDGSVGCPGLRQEGCPFMLYARAIVEP